VTTEESFDYPEGWKPKPGSVVKGPVTEVTTYSGGNFGAYPIVTIKTEAGEVAAHAFHTALRNQLAELNVQPGDEVAILYQGKKQKRDGSGSYESYRVKRLGQEGQKFDWSQERQWAAEDPVPSDVPGDTEGLRDVHRPLETREEADVPF
jgi:hypothetical protein